MNGPTECASVLIGTKHCKTPCKPGKFWCAPRRKCIYESFRCDGDNDCGWWEDERGCKITDKNTAQRIIETTSLLGCRTSEDPFLFLFLFFMNKINLRLWNKDYERNLLFSWTEESLWKRVRPWQASL